MAKLTLDKKTYIVEPLNFLSMERAWPHILVATSSLDPMAGMSAAISVIASGLMEQEDFFPLDFDIKADEALTSEEVFNRVTIYLKRKVKATDMPLVTECFKEVLEEAGIEKADEGELSQKLKEMQESSSTEASDLSSQNSSQQESKEAVGTA